ncbi:unnamed protein product [Caenorhabditis sp. 36 PRJEB53466]|nr:unnamed protein product [Caenorhabditis sp. 36 PRJEB53466]
MKILIPVLVLLLATVQYGSATDPTTDAVSTTPGGTASASTSSTHGDAASVATTSATVSGGTVVTQNPVTAVSGATTGTTGATGATGATGSSSDSTDASSTVVVSTTALPLLLTSFPISNDLSPQDAKLILQQALQLDQQINDLNEFLKTAKQDTDPNNSPLFDQLNAFSANITAQNTTLQGYIRQLQALSVTQTSIDNRLNSATDTFVCFSQSSCVTDIPTTPEPTTPGPTQAVTTCINQTLVSTETPETYNFPSTENAAVCVVSIGATVTTNNVSIAIDASFAGSNAWINLVETRTKRTISLNTTTTTAYNFTAFQQIQVQYFSDARSSVQFNFTYVEVDTCDLNCQNGGVCRVSQSGSKYCECPKCLATGDLCENRVTPCQSKQQRVCGEKAATPYGQCYENACFDQCYACTCALGPVDPDAPQSCTAPAAGATVPAIPTPITPSVCPTTAAAPTTTTTAAALFTSTVAPSTISSAGDSTATTVSVSGGTTASGGPSQSTVTGSETGSTVTGTDSTATGVVTSTVVVSSTTPNKQ